MQGYIDRAKENENVLSTLNTNLPVDAVEWPITLIFYSALHYIKAYLKFKYNIETTSHINIDNIINPQFNKSTQLPQSIYIAYNSLYQMSKAARYNPLRQKMRITLAVAKRKKAEQSLIVIKTFLKTEGLPI